MIMSMSITNDETSDAIMPRAMAVMGMEDEKLPQWPGIDFTVGADGAESEAANALIGISSFPSYFLSPANTTIHQVLQTA
jgi:hypothetical protein